MTSSSFSGSGDELDDNISDARDTFDDDHDGLNGGEVEILASVRAQEREIKNQSKDVFNRLKSIAADAAFVQRVREEYADFALVPNARCGLWYCPPEDGVTPAYFKSTDGHTNNYKFSLRRPNLHVIPTIQEHGGIILVDSTRRGKLFPDALSKTVPIWCAVINTALSFPIPGGPECWLFTPYRSVSPSEHAVIASLIPGFADTLYSSALVLPQLDKPLRPFWIHPQTTSFPVLPPSNERDFYPVICVSASRRVEGGSDGFVQDWGAGWGYVQGAGDDEESWSMGLTPQLYWQHKSELDACGRAELPELIRSLVQGQPALNGITAELPSPIAAVDGRISIGQYPLSPATPGTLQVTLLSSTNNSAASSRQQGSMIYTLPPHFKQAQSTFYQSIVPAVTSAAADALRSGHTIILADDSPNAEWASPLALILLQMFFDDSGVCLPSLGPADGEPGTEEDLTAWQVDVDKASIARRLQWVVQSCPRVNPSRTQLKGVNVLFMSGHHAQKAVRRRRGQG